MVPSVLLSMVALITNYFKESDWLLIVEESPQIRKWLKKLPWRAKLSVPCERAYKTLSETAVKSDPAFCFGPTIEKPNSGTDVKALMPRKSNFPSNFLPFHVRPH